MYTKKFCVKGMHCKSCEQLLQDELGMVNGIYRVEANSKKGEVEFDYNEKNVDLNEVRNVIEKFGYTVDEEKKEGGAVIFNGGPGDIWQWFQAAGVLVALFFVYRIFQMLGIVDSLYVERDTVSYGVALMVGLVASISSCLAVVGGVVIAFAEKYHTEERGFFHGTLKPNLIFQLGRLASFFVLGGLLGLIGGEVSISGNTIAVFTLIVGLIMGWLGLSILGLIPSISSFGFNYSSRIQEYWKNLRGSNHWLAPGILGGISFFLPCGFTQSMQIVALASGSFLKGGLLMFIFALGTTPSLLALGVTASWAKNRKMGIFQKAAGMLVVIFAIFTLRTAATLWNVKSGVITSQETKQDADKKTVDISVEKEEEQEGAQIVNMKVTANGFEPSVIKIKKDIPVVWNIEGVQVSGCTNQIIVPSLELSQNVKKGKNVVRFVPKETGEIDFSCWMGMVTGKFIVE